MPMATPNQKWSHSCHESYILAWRFTKRQGRMPDEYLLLRVSGNCCADNTFQWLIRQVDGRMIVLSDTAFHAAAGDPANLKLCPRGAWEDRMLVETVLSMLTLVCHLKKVMHRGWAYFQARLAFTMAAFNVLVQW